MNLKRQLKWQVRKFLVDHYPKMIIDHEWSAEFGHKIDWRSPRDINEKIQWLICYSDTSEWTRLADKYKVREFVKERGLGSILTNLYGVWDDARKIDFDKLPEKFVLKCNHDSASTIIVDKTKEFNKEQIVSFYQKRLKQKFGYINCEPHYNKIHPLVIAEEFLHNQKNVEDNKSLIDYKFWCFDGKVDSICVLYDRTIGSVKETVFDLDWNPHPEYVESNGHYKRADTIIERPKSFIQMLDVAKILSKGFPEVRVDLYEVDGQVFFGEMTFTSNRGRMHYVESYLNRLGQYVKLPINVR